MLDIALAGGEGKLNRLFLSSMIEGYGARLRLVGHSRKKRVACFFGCHFMVKFPERSFGILMRKRNFEFPGGKDVIG